MHQHSVQVLTADETGFIKVIDFAGSSVSSRKFGLQSAGHGVTHVAWCGDDEIVAATQQGTVRVWRPAGGEAARQLNYVIAPALQNVARSAVGVLKGVEVFEHPSTHRRVLTVAENGDAHFFSASAADCNETDPESEEYVQRFSVGSDARTLHVEPMRQEQFVVGGKENDVAVWDLSTQQQQFKCRNVPHDKLNLRQPVWVSAVKFLEPFHTIVSGTAYHQVRLYDIRAQARPVLDLEVGKHAVNCVQPVSASSVSAWGDLALKRMKGEPNSPHALGSINTPYIIVADAFGTISLRDVRKSLAVVGSFKGNAGSVRSVSLHPTLPLVAAVGMDRHLRIYHIGTQKVLKKVYLKQRLNCVLFSSRCEVLDSAENDADTNEISDAAVWSHLDQNATVKDRSSGSVVKTLVHAGVTAARSSASASTSVPGFDQIAKQNSSDDEEVGDEDINDNDDDNDDNGNDEEGDEEDDDDDSDGDEDDIAQPYQVKTVRSSIGTASKRKGVSQPHQSRACEKKGKYSK